MKKKIYNLTLATNFSGDVDIRASQSFTTKEKAVARMWEIADWNGLEFDGQDISEPKFCLYDFVSRAGRMYHFCINETVLE